MVGNNAPMLRVFEQIQLVAPTYSTVLIAGESGTGKELVVRAIHQLSPRKEGPFVALNCAAIPKDLAESELFGHARGAFTGATEKRIGKFMAAHRDTLLIDEIGEMELPVQAKLLRALEMRTITPIGSNEEQRVDVRVVAATHCNLRSLVDDGKFREDLYYRLNVVHIDLPTLRQRREDIPLLVATFLQQLNRDHGRDVQEVAPDAMDALKGYYWPGNVRELRNVLEGIMVLSRKEAIELTDLPLEIPRSEVRETVPRFRPGITLAELEHEAIQECLIQTGGNRQRTAKLLGISTRTLLRKIREYGLEDPLRRVRPPGVAEGSPFSAWKEPNITLKSHPLGRLSPPPAKVSPQMTRPPAHRLLTNRRRSPPEQAKKIRRLSIALAEPTPMPVALAADLPSDRPAAPIEAVTTLDGSMPSGAMYHWLLLCGEYSGPSR